MKRIIILNDEGEGNATLRESRYVFEISDVQLMYICPDCKSELPLKMKAESEAKGEGRSFDPHYTQCPICPRHVVTHAGPSDVTFEHSVVYEALTLYRKFATYVEQHKEEPLKFMVVERANPNREPAAKG